MLVAHRLEHAEPRTVCTVRWASMMLARLFGGLQTKAAVSQYRKYSRGKMTPRDMYALAYGIANSMRGDATGGRWVLAGLHM